MQQRNKALASWLLALMLGVTLGLAGCAGSAVYDYDANANFLARTNFKFERDDKNQKALSLDAARIENAIRREMSAKAISEVQEDPAQLHVAYRIEDATRFEATGFSYGFGMGGPHTGIGIATAPEAREIKEGKLVIDVIDPKDSRVIWRATARRNLTESMTPDDRQALIDELVHEMFGNYPPR